MLLKDEARFSIIRKIGFKNLASMSFKYFHNQFPQSTVLVKNSEYIYGTTKYERKLTKKSSLSLYMTGIAQQYSGQLSWTRNNIFGLEFNYHY
jgi:hypothetical protein